ncbi:hypothetical protein [Streptomyces sp. NPDC050504]|uniref:allene oxide cyclase barrel-like domain-containing protein n=1 Tax=Streptomyces sp. NPDC050504 TaxID=3365618 RepID=UPI00378966D9
MRKNSARPVLGKFAALSLATAAVGAFAVGSADADTSDRGRVEVVELQLQGLQYEAVDLGATGPTLGDMSVYSGTAVENGREVGHGAGTSHVVRVEGGKTMSQVVITIEIGRGTLTMQALRTGEGSSLDMAITGGTGAFKDARGTARYSDIATPQEKVRAEILH